MLLFYVCVLFAFLETPHGTGDTNSQCSRAAPLGPPHALEQEPAVATVLLAFLQPVTD